MSSNLSSISPAASVWMTRVLPSDFTTVPVRRSPFFKVTWSAKRADESPKNAVRANTSSLRSTALPPDCKESVSIWEPRVTVNQSETKTARHNAATPRCFSTRSRLALGFGVLLIGRSLCRGMIFHTVFQGTNPLAQTLAELRQFLGTEHQQGNKEDDQQVHRLK